MSETTSIIPVATQKQAARGRPNADTVWLVLGLCDPENTYGWLNKTQITKSRAQWTAFATLNDLESGVEVGQFQRVRDAENAVGLHHAQKAAERQAGSASE